MSWSIEYRLQFIFYPSPLKTESPRLRITGYALVKMSALASPDAKHRNLQARFRCKRNDGFFFVIRRIILLSM